MNTWLRIVRLALVSAAVGLLWLAGCESTDSDSSGAQAYFDQNPFQSDDRDETSPLLLAVEPASAALSVVGQEVLFTARGGEGPYSWSVTAPAKGSVHVAGWSQCRYRCLQPGNNTVRVQDQQGHFATARITPLQDAMTVQPASVTLANTLEASFTVNGGSPPYVWTTANPSLGTVAFNSATSYQASYRAVSGAHGVNVVTVRDADGRTATATVTQN